MIVWRAEMSVGVGILDDDHKALFAIINEFDTCQTRQCAETAARKLFLYTRSHFRREEAIQEQFRYPLRHEQKNDHRQIIDQLTAVIRGAFVQGGRADAEVISDISALLRRWVIGHVLREDRKMRQFFASKQRDQPQFVIRRGLSA
jgi:hemerythrin-like metal-binding protein